MTSATNQPIHIVGKIRILVDGEVIYEKENMIVNNGKNTIASRLVTTTPTINQIGVGDSNTAPSPSQNDLQGTNKLWKSTMNSSSVNNSAIFATTFFTNEANFTWRELGLRDSNNNLTARVTIADFNKTNSKNVTVEWTLTVV